ncbi:hypothetical protein YASMINEVIRUS_1292 [Yasminevirus sp. GU-2018]|uniref:RING-type domain-containing protein n=1 Tax=Yasminevirus sp. GU-2018 TaxID=2420051 RepID=A0A5K0UAP4_9VIRU|nr:hypothetical protein YASMINEVIRUS_1292 [Yasminevirus sp. GU-2018]
MDVTNNQLIMRPVDRPYRHQISNQIQNQMAYNPTNSIRQPVGLLASQFARQYVDGQLTPSNIVHNSLSLTELIVGGGVVLPIILVPFTIIVGVPFFLIVLIPYMIYKYPKLLWLIPIYVMYNLKIYGLRRLASLHRAIASAPTVRRLFGTKFMLNTFIRPAYDLSFLNLTIFFDSSPEKIIEIFDIMTREYINTVVNPRISPEDVQEIEKVRGKLGKILYQLSVVDRVNVRDNNMYYPIDHMFNGIFSAMYRTKHFEFLELVVSDVWWIKDHFMNAPERFRNADDVFNINNFVLEKFASSDFTIDERNMMFIAKVIVSGRTAQRDLTSALLDTTVSKDCVARLSMMVKDIDGSILDEDLFKRCCLTNRVRLSAYIADEIVVDVYKNYNEYSRIFEECCKNGFVEVSGVLANIYPGFKIVSIGHTTNNVTDRPLITIKYSMEHVNVVVDPIKNIIKSLKIRSVYTEDSKIAHPLRETLCVICREDNYDLVGLCGHPYCSTCVDAWFVKMKGERVCVGCRTPIDLSSFMIVKK